MGFGGGGEGGTFGDVPGYCAVELFEDFVEEGDACYDALSTSMISVIV